MYTYIFKLCKGGGSHYISKSSKRAQSCFESELLLCWTLSSCLTLRCQEYLWSSFKVRTTCHWNPWTCRLLWGRNSRQVYGLWWRGWLPEEPQFPQPRPPRPRWQQTDLLRRRWWRPTADEDPRSLELLLPKMLKLSFKQETGQKQDNVLVLNALLMNKNKTLTNQVYAFILLNVRVRPELAINWLQKLNNGTINEYFF